MGNAIALTEDVVENFMNFHDCEVVSLNAHRENVSLSLVIALKRKSLEYGASILSSFEGLVRLRFLEVTEMRIADFNHQNVIRRLSLERLQAGSKVTIESSFGLEGEISAVEVELELQ